MIVKDSYAIPTETIKPKTQSLIGSIVLDIAPSARCIAELLQ